MCDRVSNAEVSRHTKLYTSHWVEAFSAQKETVKIMYTCNSTKLDISHKFSF